MHSRNILLLLSVILLTSVSSSPEPTPWYSYEPVFMSREALEMPVEWQSAREMTKPGKIYMYGNWLLVNQPFEGIHVFDNTNPSNPQSKGFIRIPGCMDMAIGANNLYADNAVDLLTINIASLPDISISSRQRNVFPEPTPPDGSPAWYHINPGERPAGAIVVKWVEYINEPQ